jgi:hypothetical protein
MPEAREGRLPAVGGAAMPFVVERSFETASDVVARAIPDCRHCLGRSQTSAARPANEEEVVIEPRTERLEFAGQTLREARVDGLIGKRLPLDEERPFAHRPEVRNSHIGPLCAGSHINELGPRIGLEGLPDRLHVHIVNPPLVVL